ncbi:tetratricopeptide repeat protein [Pseudodesulfovibrio sp. JC047]|uniref:tetratricopeptide repeat protein n=1 Tax=Pseudodesulfovibrio sp. JC047 TaxID=2683199 RepID=UPI0013D4A064|nr:tetratricopeptide repeat protein [Pseudodesulfovibrio sp. JC047]NDV18035.1 tetratricopeptide repeat protein [Pseudodesulfovibrio sp. JC047]
MTAKAATFGRKAVIVTMVVAIGVMFMTSFVYRMDNPNLFVKVQPQHTADDGHDHDGDGMPGNAMNGAMSQVKEYMARVDADPNDVDALIGLGNSFLMMRAWDRALEPLGKARTLQPENTMILKGVGIAYFNKEDFTKASEAYEAILAIDDTDTLALFNLGVIYKHYFKKPDAAKTCFTRVLELEKDDQEMIKLAREELGQ